MLLGNGTSALQTVAPSTSGNVLTSNGTTWTSAAPAAAPTEAEQDVDFCTPSSWVYNWQWSSATVSGSGSTSSTDFNQNISTGATASSRAQRQLAATVADYFLNAPDASTTAFDFSKPFTVGFAFNIVSSSTNGQFFVRVGRSANGYSGDLANQGVGIRINDKTLVAQVHTGSTLTTSSTLKTISANSITTWVVMQSDGAGNVAVYIDGVLATTMTGGPTTYDSGAAYIVVEALNNADASTTRVHISPIKVATRPL